MAGAGGCSLAHDTRTPTPTPSTAAMRGKRRRPAIIALAALPGAGAAILATSIRGRSAAHQAVDCANVAVTVDRHKLTVIQQYIGLITPVAVEPGNRIGRFNQ